jgi:DNA-binding transcriptional MerR regulator
MFKIGDFSRLTQVSVKTLHHYDEIGLFCPMQVDRFTGYRYYSAEQLPRLMQILALKGAGFALDQIKQLVDAEMTATQVRALIEARRTDLLNELKRQQIRVRQIDFLLKQVMEDGTMSDVQVILKPVGDVWVAGAREVIDPVNMRERCMALSQEIDRYIAKHALKVTSPSMALYHDSSATGVDTVMAYYVEKPQTIPAAQGHSQVHELPAVPQMACAVYHGSYDDFAAVRGVYNAVTRWIEANGYRLNGAIREIYVQTPDWSTSDRIGLMELQFPVTGT